MCGEQPDQIVISESLRQQCGGLRHCTELGKEGTATVIGGRDCNFRE